MLVWRVIKIRSITNIGARSRLLNLMILSWLNSQKSLQEAHRRMARQVSPSVSQSLLSTIQVHRDEHAFFTN
jgi:hypothetical protein